ncbi:MAG: histidine phosphatase family protein [Clostridiales bacterium]|jgi:broad specificity phosphatase PhoE|nr:histidine phosphatase family protein [Clostridiales bacterium]
MKLIIVRHGQTDWNLNEKTQGRTDNPLNETGMAQARELAEKLRDKQIDLIISSPLLRARQTADEINKHHNAPIVIDEGCKERDFGDLEGTYCGGDQAWRYYHKDMAIPNGETTKEFTARIFKFLDRITLEYKGKYDTVLISCHGMAMRSMWWYFEGLPDRENEVVKKLDNCEVMEYEV